MPLLDQWREVILDLFKQKDWIRQWHGVGGLSAHTVHLPEEELELLLQANIQRGALLAEANAQGQFIDANKQTTELAILQSNAANTSSNTDNSDTDDFWSDAEVIHSYSRAEAIE